MQTVVTGQDAYIPFRQQAPQSHHAAESQEFVRIIGRGDLGCIGQELLEQRPVAFVGTTWASSRLPRGPGSPDSFSR